MGLHLEAITGISMHSCSLLLLTVITLKLPKGYRDNITSIYCCFDESIPDISD